MRQEEVRVAFMATVPPNSILTISTEAAQAVTKAK